MPSPEGQPIDRLAPKEREGEPAPLRMLGEPRFQNRLYRALGEEFPGKIRQRGWLVCAPASVAVAHAMSAEAHIPISLDNQRYPERIEVVLGIRNAPDGPDPKVSDHVYVLYHDGNGSVYYIDPTVKLQWGGLGEPTGDTIHIERYSEAGIEQALIENHRLYPARHKDVRSLWEDVRFLNETTVNARIAAFNGPDIVVDEPNVSGYARHERFRESVIAVIQAIQPAWRDPLDKRSDEHSPYRD